MFVVDYYLNYGEIGFDVVVIFFENNVSFVLKILVIVNRSNDIREEVVE